MKVDDKYLTIAVVISFLFLQVGCKPGRMMIDKKALTERVVLRTDSSAVLQLRDSLQIKENQLATLESDIKRVKEENFNLRSVTSRYEVKYDTNTPIDSITNRSAVLSEAYTFNKNLYRESIREYEIMLQEASIENVNLTTRNSNLQLSVENMVNENKELKQESSSRANFSYKLFLAGLVVGVVMFLILQKK